MKEIVCSNCGDPIPTLENLLYQIDRQSIGFLSGCPLCREGKLKEEIDELKKKYGELLFAVSIKHPDESRHETALRYIQQAEQQQDNAPEQQEKE